MLGHLAGPGHRVQAGVLAAAVAVDIPALAARQHVLAKAELGINRHHDALGTIALRHFLDDLRPRQGGRIETGFVGTGIEQTAHIVHGANATTHGQGNKHLRGHRLDDVQNQVTSVAGGCDVEECELVGSLLVVARRDLDRVASVAQGLKVDALNNPPTGHVQTGNDALGEHASAVELVGAGLRRRKVQVTAVDRTAADHAFNALVFHLAQRLDVGDVAQAT